MPSIDAPGRSRPMTRSHADDGLMQQRLCPGYQRFLLQRNPDVGRVAAQRFAEESRGATPTIVKGCPSTANVEPTTDGSQP